MVKRQAELRSLVRVTFLPFLKNRIRNFPEVLDMNDQVAGTAVTLPMRGPKGYPCLLASRQQHLHIRQSFFTRKGYIAFRDRFGMFEELEGLLHTFLP